MASSSSTLQTPPKAVSFIHHRPRLLLPPLPPPPPPPPTRMRTSDPLGLSSTAIAAIPGYHTGLGLPLLQASHPPMVATSRRRIIITVHPFAFKTENNNCTIVVVPGEAARESIYPRACYRALTIALAVERLTLTTRTTTMMNGLLWSSGVYAKQERGGDGRPACCEGPEGQAGSTHEEHYSLLLLDGAAPTGSLLQKKRRPTSVQRMARVVRRGGMCPRSVRVVSSRRE